MRNFVPVSEVTVWATPGSNVDQVAQEAEIQRALRWGLHWASGKGDERLQAARANGREALDTLAALRRSVQRRLEQGYSVNPLEALEDYEQHCVQQWRGPAGSRSRQSDRVANLPGILRSALNRAERFFAPNDKVYQQRCEQLAAALHDIGALALGPITLTADATQESFAIRLAGLPMPAPETSLPTPEPTIRLRMPVPA